jgi:hypothetical protein
MANLKSINGTYGASKTPCTIFVYEMRNGKSWYCVEDSRNVNLTYDELEDGIDVECVSDIDTWSSNRDIETLSELENFIEN